MSAPTSKSEGSGAHALASALNADLSLGSLTTAAPGGDGPAGGSALVTCHRVGCGEKFDPENNAEGSCRHHPSGPYFHDGVKEWPCCKKRHHDFGEFLEIPGCATGKHSSEKAAPPPKPSPALAPSPAAPLTASATTGTQASCPRCSQGFFCSDHAGLPPSEAPKKQPEKQPQPAAAAPTTTSPPNPLPPPPKVTKPAPVPDSDGFLTCKHYACGLKYKEEENNGEVCLHHPGPAVFHDRKKGWGCCEKFEKDFDAFLSIPPCTRGKHDATFDASF